MNSGRVSSGIPVQQLEAALNGISKPPSPHSSSARRGGDEADGAEHPLPGEQQQHHRREHQSAMSS
jgi:hypothetical protein